MAPERIERLRRIAAMTWRRTLDDRVGISWEEKQRKERTPAVPLPVAEKLIDDKPEHLIERAENERMPEDNRWGFKLDVPEYKCNRGELYNLEVARGTLSARMMAIADIFEALTAADRPYKKAKTLSEALRILGFMRDDRHINADLFELFLTSGVWRRYGEQYLRHEQIDKVDIGQYL